MYSSSNKSAIFFAALLASAFDQSTAYNCNLCVGLNNDFSHVPQENAQKTVETSLGTQNCEGFYLAALNGGVISSQNECLSVRQQFAPTCCNAASASTASATTSAESLIATTGPSPTPAPTSATTSAPTNPSGSTAASEAASFHSATSGSSGNPTLCTGPGYCCDFSVPTNQFDEVPQANHQKTVATDLGTVNCFGFSNAASNGDVIQGQNHCLQIAQQFAPICCNMHVSRRLRGSSTN